MININNSNNFYFSKDKTNDNNFSIRDNNNYNDIFSFNDNILDLSFLPLSENKLFEIEIIENNKSNINNKEQINFITNQKAKKNINKKIFLLKGNEEITNKNNNDNYIYRKDAYYKHFKSIFAKYLKDKANKLKNICFPNFYKNNFFSLVYKYTGNPKEKDNYQFLFFKVKDLLIYGRNDIIKNRQYYNSLLIKYIEESKKFAQNETIYQELIRFLNESVETELINFYNDDEQFEIINKDSKCLFYDYHFKKQTGISLLEKNGFIQILKSNFKK